MEKATVAQQTASQFFFQPKELAKELDVLGDNKVIELLFDNGFGQFSPGLKDTFQLEKEADDSVIDTLVNRVFNNLTWSSTVLEDPANFDLNLSKEYPSLRDTDREKIRQKLIGLVNQIPGLTKEVVKTATEDDVFALSATNPQSLRPIKGPLEESLSSFIKFASFLKRDEHALQESTTGEQTVALLNQALEMIVDTDASKRKTPPVSAEQQKRLLELEQQSKGFKEHVERLISDLQDAKRETEEERKKLLQKESEHAQTRATLQEAEKRAKEAEKEVEQLRHKNQQFELEKSQKQLEEVLKKQSSETLKQQLADLQKKFGELDTKLQEQIKANEAATKKTAEAQEKYEIEMAALEKRNSELLTKIEQLNLTHGSGEGQESVDLLRQKVEALTSELQSFKEESEYDKQEMTNNLATLTERTAYYLRVFEKIKNLDINKIRTLDDEYLKALK